MITNIELAYHTESWGLDDYVTGLRHISDAGFTGVEVLPEVVRSFARLADGHARTAGRPRGARKTAVRSEGDDRP